ncbi:hypothetical protein AAMO2058_000194300 [Amorphochlora amoebiformis]
MAAIPVQLWGLDPMFWSYVKLTVKDIKSLGDTTPRGAYWLKTHPIQKTEAVGSIVDVVIKPKYSTYTIDDGSGCMNCTVFYSSQENSKLKDLSLGDVVRVVGGISTFRDRREIRIEKIAPERDPNALTLHWLECAQLAAEVYSNPIHVECEEERKKGRCSSKR